jgi:hypothetical protein
MTAFFPRNSRYLAAPCLALALIGFTSAPARAQATQSAPKPAQHDQAQAEDVREGLMKVLDQYPPEVGSVLKLDPSLLASEAYLAGYKTLVTYLNEHPEIRRSPAFYFENVQGLNSHRSVYDRYYYDPRNQAWNQMTEMATILGVTISMVIGFVWLVRTAIDYRRWGRLARVQAEAHTKLLDRFAGNDELLAYVQSPAGTRFLQSSPIALDGTAKPVGAPIARILWSMQAGVVAAAAGIGLYYVSKNIDVERAEPVFMFAILLLAVGLGFVVSAGLSFALSRRLGLLELPKATATDQG